MGEPLLAFRFFSLFLPVFLQRECVLPRPACVAFFWDFFFHSRSSLLKPVSFSIPKCWPLHSPSPSTWRSSALPMKFFYTGLPAPTALGSASLTPELFLSLLFSSLRSLQTGFQSVPLRAAQTLFYKVVSTRSISTTCPFNPLGNTVIRSSVPVPTSSLSCSRHGMETGFREDRSRMCPAFPVLCVFPHSLSANVGL